MFKNVESSYSFIYGYLVCEDVDSPLAKTTITPSLEA